MSYFSRFNPMPAFPAYEGPYQVGTAEIELPVKDLADSSITPPNPDITTVHFRIFYPCEPGSTNPRPVRWLPSPQRNILTAYVEFIGAGSYMANAISLFPQHLYYINIPVTRDAPLLQASTSTSKWPVMIFSHGLGGSKNAYSHMCGSMASHGMVVIAPEHRDASCPISFIRSTDSSPRREIRYKRYSHAPSPEVYEGRDAQLKIRLWEMNLIHTALLRLEAGNVPKNLKTDCVDLSMFQGKLDVTRPGAITFGGHSFGACTTVQTVKSTFYNDRTLFTPSPALRTQITTTTPVILLDLWTLPLGSPNTAALWEKPMPCFSSPTTPSGVPLIAVLSESFVKWPVNLNYTKKTLKDPYSSSATTPRSAAHLFYPLRSAHLSQSDFAILFPTVTRYLAKADDPGRTINLNVRAILQALREGGVEVVGFSQTGGRDEDANLNAKAEATEEAELVGGSESDTADDSASDGIANSENESESESEAESDSDIDVDDTSPVDVFQTPFEMPADASPFDFTELESAADLLPVPDPKSSAPMATLKFQPGETASANSDSISVQEGNGEKGAGKGMDWDFSILSTRKGAVRGWVAVDVA